MFATEAELALFIDWIFLEVATRPRAGRNPTESIRGIYIEYEDPTPTKRGKGGLRKSPGSMRRSDIAMRRYVAIEALMKHGRSLKTACADVAICLEKANLSEMRSTSTGDSKIKAIRTAYLKCRHPLRHSWLSLWTPVFKNWLDWEIKENLMDSSIPIEILAEVVKMHASKILGDAEKGAAFTAKWRVLAGRAIALFGRH
jgi:hypothetical protein